MLAGSDFNAIARAFRGGLSADSVNQFPGGEGEACVNGAFTVGIFTTPETVAAIAHEWRTG